MQPPSATSATGATTVSMTSPDGACARLSLQGAHLLSWQPAGGDEQLYLSPCSGSGAATATRGGVPVIFPQFALIGPGPRHGFARTALWELVANDQGTDDALAVLRLRDNDQTRQAWPHAFELELTVRIAGATLDIELACDNRSEQGFSFTAALHTYLAVSDLDAVSVQGLSGVGYADKVTGRDERQRTELLLPGEKGVLDLDRIYFQVPGPVTLVEQLAGQSERRVEIDQQGFEDVVVWNPGPQRCAQLPDMPPQGWRQMLCIEAARIGNPIHLPPGQTWVGRQRLSLI